MLQHHINLGPSLKESAKNSCLRIKIQRQKTTPSMIAKYTATAMEKSTFNNISGLNQSSQSAKNLIPN